MNKPLLTLTTVALMAATASPAFAHGDGDDYCHCRRDYYPRMHDRPFFRYDDDRPAYGKVIDVQPIIRTVTVATPRQICRPEEVVERTGPRPSAVPTVVGGVMGGVIGHQIGNERTRGVTTVAGAVLGAAIGNDIGRRSGEYHTVVTTREVCQTVQDYRQEQQSDGYRVTYRYRGEIYTTRMDEAPGDFVRVELAQR